jgi:hypothetical protein
MEEGLIVLAFNSVEFLARDTVPDYFVYRRRDWSPLNNKPDYYGM